MEKLKVRILGISCAHRKSRNTAWMVQHGLKAAEKFGRRINQIADVETEFFDLADKRIRACLGCDMRPDMTNMGIPYKGKEKPESGCIIKNDYIARELMPKMAEADGFIFGSPVFGLSYSSKFAILSERLSHGIWKGHLTNKPFATVAVATLPLGGQETCLLDMTRRLQGAEMICVNWLNGAPGVSGPPYGPLPNDDDGKVIAVKNDRFGKWLSLVVGRRVAEFAVMLKLAKRELGELYTREFVQVYHPPHGDEPWAWTRLDKEDEEFMNSLEGVGLTGFRPGGVHE